MNNRGVRRTTSAVTQQRKPPLRTSNVPKPNTTHSSSSHQYSGSTKIDEFEKLEEEVKKSTETVIEEALKTSRQEHSKELREIKSSLSDVNVNLKLLVNILTAEYEKNQEERNKPQEVRPSPVQESRYQKTIDELLDHIQATETEYMNKFIQYNSLVLSLQEMISKLMITQDKSEEVEKIEGISHTLSSMGDFEKQSVMIQNPVVKKRFSKPHIVKELNVSKTPRTKGGSLAIDLAGLTSRIDEASNESLFEE